MINLSVICSGTAAEKCHVRSCDSSSESPQQYDRSINSGPSVMPIVPVSMRQPEVPALSIEETGTTPHAATLVNPICAKRFHRHYIGQPALLRTLPYWLIVSERFRGHYSDFTDRHSTTVVSCCVLEISMCCSSSGTSHIRCTDQTDQVDQADDDLL